MCGRTAQTRGAVMAAASSLASKGGTTNKSSNSVVDKIGPRSSGSDENDAGPRDGNHDDAHETTKSSYKYPWRDNYNLSPGHDAVVFYLNDDGELQMDRKVWGLVPKGGTTKSPLPPGPSKHFANLMFNARSDTLFAKPTFSRLLNHNKTCLVAFDGFFEWKDSLVGARKGKKQPYYVYRKKDANHKDQSVKSEANDHAHLKLQQQPYLLMAGLWTKVATGYTEEPSFLDTFTIVTTEVSDELEWLHTRMPICIWDETLAWKWLEAPKSSSLLKELDKAARYPLQGVFSWHSVTTEMNSTKFRGADCVKPLPPVKTLKTFFQPKKSSKDAAVATTEDAPKATIKLKQEDTMQLPVGSTLLQERKTEKRPFEATSPTKSSIPTKKVRASPSGRDSKKKRTIADFFSPT